VIPKFAFSGPADLSARHASNAFKMAISHFDVQVIGAARSPIAMAAYRHRESMLEVGTSTLHKAVDQGDLVHAEVSAPDDAPAWVQALLGHEKPADQSAALWNAVVDQTTRKNGQYAREFAVALPLELSRAENIALVRAFVRDELTAKGFIVDWVFHDKVGNPHVHIMHTVRRVDADGFGSPGVPLVGADGQQVRHNGKLRYRSFMGGKEEFHVLRQAWGAYATHHLAEAGFSAIVDMRSYAEQGIALMPTVHRGPAVSALITAPGGSVVGDILRKERAQAVDEIEQDVGLLIDKVAKQNATFGVRAIAKALHEYLDKSMQPERFNCIVAKALASPKIYTVRPDVYDPVTGRQVVRAVYATHEMRAMERDMMAAADRLKLSGAHATTPDAVATAIGKRGGADAGRAFELAQEQADAIAYITDTRGIACVVGIAGAGKSTMLEGARSAWEGEGKRVHGATLAGKAADGLLTSSGIAARTICSWEYAWSRGRDLLQAGDVFVVDEAGMVASRHMQLIIKAVEAAGAKLVLVGDPKQLQPIEAGAPFRVLVQTLGAAEMTEVRRQRTPWQQEATRQLARDETVVALAAYRAAGCLLEVATKDQARDAMLRDYLAARAKTANPDSDSVMMLAHTNVDVHALNQGARSTLQAAGIIGEGADFLTTRGSRQFGAGDRVIFLEGRVFTCPSAPELGRQRVRNGTLGTVVAAADDTLRVQLDGKDAPLVAFASATYANIDHGYAATIHKNQGVTVERAFVLASPTMDASLTYVALSRHRESVGLYAPKEGFEQRSLEQTLSRVSVKTSTLDYADLAADADSFAASRGFQSLADMRDGVAATLAFARAQLKALWERAKVAARKLMPERPVTVTVVPAATQSVRGAVEDPAVTFAKAIERVIKADLALALPSSGPTQRDVRAVQHKTACVQLDRLQPGTVAKLDYLRLVDPAVRQDIVRMQGDARAAALIGHLSREARHPASERAERLVTVWAAHVQARREAFEHNNPVRTAAVTADQLRIVAAFSADPEAVALMRQSREAFNIGEATYLGTALRAPDIGPALTRVVTELQEHNLRHEQQQQQSRGPSW
jgi:Ti-type conjugative transfer relaxase TraA